MSRTSEITDAYLNSLILRTGLSGTSGVTGNAVFDNYLRKAALERVSSSAENNRDRGERISSKRSAAESGTVSGRAAADGMVSGSTAESTESGQKISSESGMTEDPGEAGSLEEIFQRASAAYGVSSKLLKAVAKHESGFNPSATSYAGAMGVMQLMPGTAAAMGVTDPYDAEQNIMGGARLLARLLKEYDGSLSLALAAYSAGEGNVAKYGGIPPFSETQSYVKSIMESMNGEEPIVSAPKTTEQEDAPAGLAGSESGAESDTVTLDRETFDSLIQMLRIRTLMDNASSIGGLYSDDGSGISI
ncbi:lytic transglycosylase domain-containing protein [Bilifractor sp. LCP21S3_A7]|uniref:lytic transglycosylase domain-containing protein n=1 Tax=Bilifractor sp. LCP21S3_A7 TaxID=3438738 RepID=UPI003F90C313